MSTIDPIRQFALLAVERRRLEAELEKVDADMDSLGESVLNAFISQGIQNVAFDDLKITLYVHSQIWPKLLSDRAAALEALRQSDLGALVQETYNSNQLAAWIREQPRDEEGKPVLPESFQGVIDTVEKLSVRHRAR